MECPVAATEACLQNIKPQIHQQQWKIARADASIKTEIKRAPPDKPLPEDWTPFSQLKTDEEGVWGWTTPFSIEAFQSWTIVVRVYAPTYEVYSEEIEFTIGQGAEPPEPPPVGSGPITVQVLNQNGEQVLSE